MSADALADSVEQFRDGHRLGEDVLMAYYAVVCGGLVLADYRPTGV